jgi:hypothetical protein
VRIDRSADGFLVIGHDGALLAPPQEDAFVAAYLCLEAMIAAFLAQNPDQLFLHAGGLLRSDGLIAFAGASMAGKSSLALHLTGTGQRIFGDDRLLIDAGAKSPVQGIALGVAQKLRGPPPQNFAPTAKAHLADRGAAQSDDNHFLAWSDTTQMESGTTAPLRAILTIDRNPDLDRTRISPLTRPEAVKALVRLTKDVGSAPEMLAKTVRLATSVPVLRLSAP